MSVLLNYVMKVSKTIPIAAPNLQYLQNALIVVKQKTAETPKTVVRIVNADDLAAITDSTAPLDFLKGGKSYFYALPIDDLTLNSATITNINEFKYFTILIDPSGFDDEAVESLVLPDDFTGVVGGASNDDAFVGEQNKKKNYSWFWEKTETAGKNMYKAFGSLLNKPKNRWSNQQYLAMDYDDGITDLGTAESMFDMRLNFVLTDEEYASRLALFCVGANGQVRAIVAPYLYEDITVTLQGAALTWINLNEPAYTVTQASLLQGYLQKKLNTYIENGDIDGGTVQVEVGNEQFIMTGQIIVPEVSALWRLKVNFQEGEI